MPYLASSGGSSAKCETLATGGKRDNKTKQKKQKEGEIQCVVLAVPNTRMMSFYNNLQLAIFITAL